jgi:hypothetical protein
MEPNKAHLAQFLETSRQVDNLEREFITLEAQNEERWKTTFSRLEHIEEGLRRIDSRMLSMGGLIIIFLAGLVVTLATTGVA